MKNFLFRQPGPGTFILSFLLLWLLYPVELFNANKLFFGNKEDGLKNYYTLVYHVKYDSSYTHFEGMNYPAGEHVVFTDGQPLVGFVLKFIHTHFFPIGDYSIGIMNLLMLIGVCAGSWLLYRIFKELAVPVRFAVPFAILISFLSPQLARLNAHYALAYSFILPWFIWQALMFVKNPNWTRTLIIALGMAISLWIHLYYLLIAGFFLGVFYVISWIRLPKKIPIASLVVHAAVQLIAPLLLFFMWLHLTNTIGDRPAAPYGMREYMAFWEGSFLPLSLPMGEWLKEQIDIRAINYEGTAYIGLPASLFFIYMLISWPWRYFRKPKNYVPAFLPHAEILFVSGLLVYIYAATIPFLIENPFLETILGPLRQFRSLGRLGWLFFYCINIWMIWYLTVNIKNARTKKILVTMAAILLVYECWAYNNRINIQIGHDIPSPDISPYTGSEDRNPVIVPLPYFHIGSENIGTRISANTLIEPVLQLSLLTGLPTTGSVMSRTSISQTMKQLEFAYNLSGPVAASLQDLLIVLDSGYFPRLELMLNGGTPLPDFEGHPVTKTNINKIQLQLESEKQKYLPLAQNPLDFLFYESFNSGKSPGINGGTAKSLLTGEIFRYNHLNPTIDTVEIYGWLHANRDYLNSYKIQVSIVSKEGKAQTTSYMINHITDNVVDNFARIKLMENLNEGDQLIVNVINDRQAEQAMIADEFLIVPKGTNYSYFSQTTLFSSGFVFLK